MNLLDLITEWYHNNNSRILARLVNIQTDLNSATFVSNGRPVRAYFVSLGGPDHQTGWLGDIFEEYVELRSGDRLHASDPEFFAKLERYINQ